MKRFYRAHIKYQLQQHFPSAPELRRYILQTLIVTFKGRLGFFSCPQYFKNSNRSETLKWEKSKKGKIV